MGASSRMKAGAFPPPPFLESTFENGCLVRMKAGAVVFEQSYVLLAQSIAPV
jgi:hypothetical protein